MKFALILSIPILLASTASTCRSKTNTPGVYHGRLEVKGGCMNYTIAITDKNVDTTMVVPSWTDEGTGKTYRNVFALGSPCTFPDTIAEGDSFTFSIDSTSKQDCSVCMMYYPTPQKRLKIKVLNP
jgi:hypothetical protein